jgi:type II secretory pathway pseudopilin PulG
VWRSRSAAIVALALVAAGGWFFYTQRQQQQRANAQSEAEATLRVQLSQIRAAIRQFRTDTGNFPATLEELTPKYLPEVPADPITGSRSTWQLVKEDVVLPNNDFSTAESTTRSYIIDVQSGAGRPYSEY